MGDILWALGIFGPLAIAIACGIAAGNIWVNQGRLARSSPSLQTRGWRLGVAILIAIGVLSFSVSVGLMVDASNRHARCQNYYGC